MTHTRSSLLGLAVLLGAFGGCATAPVAGGGMDSFQSRAAAAPAVPVVEHPGPGWLLLGSTDEGSLYMHPRSTLRVGSSAFIMVVANRRQPVVLPGGASVGSVRERIEIDCHKRRYRRHDGSAHPDHVGLGPVLGQVGQEQWRDVSPSTVMAAVSSAVCSATAPGTAAPNTQGAPPEPALPRFPRNRRGTFST